MKANAIFKTLLVSLMLMGCSNVVPEPVEYELDIMLFKGMLYAKPIPFPKTWKCIEYKVDGAIVQCKEYPANVLLCIKYPSGFHELTMNIVGANGSVYTISKPFGQQVVLELVEPEIITDSIYITPKYGSSL